jgi:hypothetical protein
MHFIGKIIVQTNPESFLKEPEKFISKQLEIEQYLNDKVAMDMFKKFNVMIRVHF